MGDPGAVGLVTQYTCLLMSIVSGACLIMTFVDGIRAKLFRRRRTYAYVALQHDGDRESVDFRRCMVIHDVYESSDFIPRCEVATVQDPFGFMPGDIGLDIERAHFVSQRIL